MSAGLSTPLHLAANLLALFAAAGLALAVLRRPGAAPGERGRAGGREPAALLVAAGAAVIAVGHGLSGALLEGGAGAVPWLLAAGLVAVAVGMSPRGIAPSRAAARPAAPSAPRTTGPAVLIPAVIVTTTPVPAAVVGAVAGAAAGVRALLGGPRTIAVGIGLILWAAARAVAPNSPGPAAWLTIAGALALGVWLWQASAPRLLAKLVTAFISSLLGVVVLLAVVLSTIGSTSLVEEELRNLGTTSSEVAQALTDTWPREAAERAALLGRFPDTVLGLVDSGSVRSLEDFLESLATDQDVLAILDPNGRVRLAAGRLERFTEGSFLLSLAGSDPVDRLIGGQERSGGLLTVGGEVVAVGGVLVFPEGERRPEDRPVAIVVAGRVADGTWASTAASQQPLELLLTVGGELAAASGDVAGVPPAAVAGALRRSGEAAAVSVGGRELFAASAPLVDPNGVRVVGEVVAARSGEVLAQLERDQARQLFVIALVGGLLAGLVAAAVSGRLVAPIRRLTEAAASVREGHLDAHADVRSPDEVGELGRTFNEMTTSLAAQSAQLRDAAEVQSRLRARLEALNASMSDALVAIDPDGRIVTFNPAAERLVGRAVEDALGLRLSEVLVGSGPNDTTPTVALGAPDSERTVAVQLLLDGPEGRVTPTAATAAPVRGPDGAVLGRVLVLRDVTREVEIERMKSEFLSNVSHELRTPLTPIKGYAEILARRDLRPDAAQRFAGQILESTEQLERIVGMIVDFAALDSGRVQPRPVPVEVGDLVGDTLARWRSRAPDRTFTRRVSRGLPKVAVDPVLMAKCLDELIDNAVKFSPNGEPVNITAGAADGRVCLSVRDRGVGIELEAASKAFSDFFQADGSETRHFGGLGLGLALVRRIVDVLGADATIESEPGQGATVHLDLPIAE
jgi:PAS domain S-box-containing protein